MADYAHNRIGTLSPQMALLGMLYGGPMHGYDLHRKVNIDLGYVWHLSQSQAYSIIKRLEKSGDIAIEEVAQEKLPPRQMLHLTSQGCERFLHWLDTPSGGSVRSIRLEFVTRLYFFQRYMPAKVSQVFIKQKLEAERQLIQLKKKHAELPVDQVYNRMSLDMRLRELNTVMEWLDDCQKVSLA